MPGNLQPIRRKARRLAMNELRVTFATDGDSAYRAQLTDADGNTLGVEVPIRLFLTEADYENLRWYLEDYMDLPDGGAVIRAQHIEEDLERWGRRLHDDLFTAEENRDLLKQLLANPEPRTITIATQDLVLLRLPWELMADDSGSLAQRVSVRRQLETSKRTPRPAPNLSLRILYILSRPADATFVDPRQTTKALFEAIDPLGSGVRVDFCRPPTLAHMEDMLRDGRMAGDPYDLVHFDGAGTFLPQSQIGALYFERPDNGSGDFETDVVPADRLGDLLAGYDIPLVVLEVCRGATAGKAVVFRSVAPRLIQAGVGSVLSMGHAMHFEAARLLLGRFYRELMRGRTIGDAVVEARKALASTPVRRRTESGPHRRAIELRDWFLPHLYQRDVDVALVPPNADGWQAEHRFDVFLSQNHNDSARVQALARLLGDRHGLRVWLDLWECGPGKLEPQCEIGIKESRFTAVVGSNAALSAGWVQWEIDQHERLNPEGDRLIPIKFEPLKLPHQLDDLLWIDFTDPDQDVDNTAQLARVIRSADADDARRRRGFRSPSSQGEPGSFPPPPRYGFHGRARELYELERWFRRDRGIVLHGMGGMGKTALAAEAAHWWTRSGLYRDGACFLSFEPFTSADRVVQVLGTYAAGPRFEQLPSSEQRRRVVSLFAERDVIMVWDNFDSVLPQFNGVAALGITYNDDERRRLAELFRDLTSGPGKGRLLVTCRPGDTGLPGAQRYELCGLDRADSLWLLHRILEDEGVNLSDFRLTRDELEPLLRDLADHPLSLELVGPQLRGLTPEEIRADFDRLIEMMRQESDQGRNTSLLASLEFSRRHLSPAARAALPWLGLFRGGVHEQLLLAVSQLDSEAWEPIRRELQGIALVRPEDDTHVAGRPFLRFHPTLASAAAEAALVQEPETRERFINVYGALMQGLNQALRGSQSRTALEILDREEANYRTAVHWAVADQQFQAAAALGNTFRDYLERSGRLRERDNWVQWLKDAVTQQGFTPEAADYERQHAYTRFAQGDPQGAMEQVRSLIERLRHTAEFDPAFQLALAIGALGDMLDERGASTQAIPFLRESIGQWEALVEKAGGQPWEKLLSTPDHAKPANELANLSATMGNLANALSAAGRHAEALAVAEKCVGIQQTLGNQRDLAADHGRCAGILMASGRYDMADARYDIAVAAARQVGDKGLEGTILASQGTLAWQRNDLDRATGLYQQSLRLSQEAGDQGAMMRAYNSLGEAERMVGRLAEARAWYEKTRELAVKLKHQVGLGLTVHNIGILSTQEGDGARDRGDEFDGPAALRGRPLLGGGRFADLAILRQQAL